MLLKITCFYDTNYLSNLLASVKLLKLIKFIKSGIDNLRTGVFELALVTRAKWINEYNIINSTY